MATVRGGCACGRLRVVATGAALRVGLCHCLDCRKHHGALFYAVLCGGNLSARGGGDHRRGAGLRD